MGRVKSVTAQSKKGKKNTDADSEGKKYTLSPKPHITKRLRL